MQLSDFSDDYSISGTQRNIEHNHYKIIAIHFPKIKFDIVDAIRWLLQHEYAIGPMDDDDDNYIFNQLPEHVVKLEGFTELRHRTIRHGVILYMLYKPNEYHHSHIPYSA